jgi:hypothetical protein
MALVGVALFGSYPDHGCVASTFKSALGWYVLVYFGPSFST